MALKWEEVYAFEHTPPPLLPVRIQDVLQLLIRRCDVLRKRAPKGASPPASHPYLRPFPPPPPRVFCIVRQGLGKAPDPAGDPQKRPILRATRIASLVRFAVVRAWACCSGVASPRPTRHAVIPAFMRG